MIPELKIIKSLRKKIGITQKGLAKAIGLSQSYINKIENGYADPPFTIAKKIIDYLTSMKDKDSVKAKDLMTMINSVKPEEDLSKAITLMDKLKVSQLPVIKDGLSIGSITNKTIPRLLVKGLKLQELRVDEVMDEAFPLIPENSPVKLIGELLEYHQAVIVTKKGKLKGIITSHDLNRLI